jgi:hypothetical protein
VSDPFDKANAAKYADAGWDGTVPAPARVDITGGVLAAYPGAVVIASRTESGTYYEVRIPGRVYAIRHHVEYGDDEAEALAYILDWATSPDTWNGR